MKIIELIHQGGAVLVDNNDYDELDKYNWRIKREKHILYARRTATREERLNGYPLQVLMHRQIMGIILDKDTLVDHRDNNGLNNQRNNLRVATRQQNTINTPNRCGNSSIYKGVTAHGNGYIARIGYNNKMIYLGWFNNELDAAIAYNNKATELYNEFANINKIN